MKKTKKVISILLVMVLFVISLASCGKASYSATTGFFYSGDKGHTYGDGTKEYEVGETVYMKVKFKVVSDEKKITQVKAVLTIPKIENVDAKYMDGQVITPNFDAVNNVTTYELQSTQQKKRRNPSA